MKVLDCTFRDGGYYTNWDFKQDLVKKYLRAIDLSKVDAVELGFRFTPKKDFIGAFGYSSDEFLRNLSLPDIPIGVMVNGSDITSISAESMFRPVDESPVDLVRLALHYGRMKECETFVKGLRDLGYDVAVNMMQTGGKTNKEIREAVCLIKNWGSAFVLYFADSFGDMSPDDVVRITETIKTEWEDAIGFHGHDNKGQALINSITAKESGVEWIDSTILGMGRGAGNTKTEHLLTELKSKGEPYNPESVFALALEDFTDLQKKYNWGSNLMYYLSATYNIHPTYVQEMSLMQYDTHQMLEGIKKLSKLTSNSFNKQKLLNVLEEDELFVEGDWSPANWIKNKDVLVIAAGPTVKKYQDALINYVHKKNPFVLCLNCNTDFPNDIVDTYAVCDYTRIMTELYKYKQLEKPVMMPRRLCKEDFSEIQILDYGLGIQSGKWKANQTDCTIPGMLVAAYTLAALSISGANRILLAGFDGYKSDDHRQTAMAEVFDLYNGPSLLSITPTTYKIDKASVFEPQFSGD